MKIIELYAENVKRIKAVRIKPDGSLIVIGGENAQGKTSVLDAIMAGLGGKGNCPDKPLREGAEKGTVEIDLDRFKVKRTFTPTGGGQLTVANKDGSRFPSPQSMLDDLLGELTFDPLAFAKSKEKEQIEMLQKIVGIDFDDFNKRFKEDFDGRTDANREIKKLTVAIEELERQVPKDAPLEAVSVSGLIEKLQEAQRHNEKVREAVDRVSGSKLSLNTAAGEVAHLEKRLKQARMRHAMALKSLKTNQVNLASMQKINTDHIEEQIKESESKNILFRKAESLKQLTQERRGWYGTARDLSAKLEGIQKEKADAIAAAHLPVSGLSFDDDGITYNGQPFSQASDAEQLRVSVALGIAANPELKVLLIRNGSLLDKKNLALVAKMAEEAGAQVWMERVGEDEATTIVMEDGEVRDASN